MREVVNGNGRWRLTYLDNGAVMAEIWVAEGQRMVVGTREFAAQCARCTASVAACTPDNAEGAVCAECRREIVVKYAQREAL